MIDYDRISARPGNPRRPGKNALAVRMFVVKLAWLDGLLYWRDGRVAWVTPESAFFPKARDLARAQTRLNKLAVYKQSAPLVLGDSEEWLRVRRERLELAKRLHVLRGTEVRLSVGHHSSPLRRLAELLPAEALCLNALPASPSHALMLAGQPAEPFLRELIANGAYPPGVASLAALCLGAIHARIGTGSSFNTAASVRSSYDWGLRSGLSEQPGLVATLLVAENGHEIARRCLAALKAPEPFAFSAETVRILVSENGPETAVALAEAAAYLEPVVTRLCQYRDALPAKDSQMRASVAADFAGQRLDLFNELASLAQQYLLATRQPTVAKHIGKFLESLSDLALTPDLWRIALVPALNEGLALPSGLHGDYLTLLTECNAVLWKRSGKQGGRPETLSHRMRNWLQEVHSHRVLPLLRLVSKTGNREVVREAVRMDVYIGLSRQDWHDPELFSYCLELLQELRTVDNDDLRFELCFLFRHLETARQAREIVTPLMRLLARETEETRKSVFYAVIETTTTYAPKPAEYLASVREYLPLLISRVRSPDTMELLPEFLRAAFVLVQSKSQAGKDFFAALMDETLANSKRGSHESDQLPPATRIAAALADDSVPSFRAIFKAALQLDLADENERIERCLMQAGKFTDLRALLARVFPHQAKRCFELLTRLGLTSRLGAEVTLPLEFTRPQETATEVGSTCYPVVLCRDAGWRRVMKMLPELAPQIAAYQHARWLLREPGELTPGIQGVLAQPQQWAMELERLGAMIVEQPERADLRKRAERLRVRLEDKEAWGVQARSEIKERLQTVTDEAQLQALGKLIDRCFLNRLAIVAGPLPEQTVMTPDLMNATLLSADITRNKKLLQKLLRGHLFGPKEWRERHPANEAFLKSLAANGVDTGVWLSENPRRYACAKAAAGRLHLRLERDPLHILQMGNYFGTCLSLDGGNSFSTVANACELNKRVIYARDGNGKVVGRKLIGISSEGKLVGFRVYGALTESAGNKQLLAIFRHYGETFANRCGLTLANNGNVPKLFAEAWYDDGEVAWEGEADEACGASSIVKRALSESARTPGAYIA